MPRAHRLARLEAPVLAHIREIRRDQPNSRRPELAQGPRGVPQRQEHRVGMCERAQHRDRTTLDRRVDPDVRFAVRQFLPDMDLDDPAALAELRKFSLPPCIFEDLRRVGEASYTAASHVTAPTLVLQGLQDGLVASRGTRALVSRIPGPLTYREIEGPHELLDPHAVSWPTVTAAVLDFATGLTMQSTVPARSVAG